MLDSNTEIWLGDTDHDKITDLLVGSTVTKVTDDTVMLDNGTTLQFVGNEGGCSCSSGDYDLTVLNSVDNVITNVEFLDDPSEDYHEGEGYKIFVFAGEDKINLAAFEGDDGNGYYGTGYSIHVKF